MIRKMAYIGPFGRTIEFGFPIAIDAYRRGYAVGLYVDSDKFEIWRSAMRAADMDALLMTSPEYHGYPIHNNELARQMFALHPECDWALCGSDDTWVDPNWHPNHIALQLEAHFGGTMGICQPTGDPFRDAMGKIIERIAGSPICGREFCQRVNQGRGGPFHPGFKHMWCDNALQETAKRLGVFLQRDDLTHRHNHFTRVGDEASWTGVEIPAHLRQWNTREHWDWSKALYERLEATGFAECMPLPEVADAPR